MGRKSIETKDLNNVVKEVQPEIKRPRLTKSLKTKTIQGVVVPSQCQNIDLNCYGGDRKHKFPSNNGLLMASFNIAHTPDGWQTGWGVEDEEIAKGDQPAPIKQKEETKE